MKPMIATLIALTCVISWLGSSPSAFGDTLITFDEFVLPANSAITDEYASLGVVFANSYYDVQGWTVPTGHHIANFTVGPHHPYFEISFLELTQSAEFLLLTNPESGQSGPPGQSTFQALRDGSVVSEFVGDTDLVQRPFGFSGVLFDQIRVYPGGWGQWGRLDNLRFQVVPEPASSTLAVAAVVILLSVGRRRRVMQGS